jgi:hypothetical protein
MTLNSKDLIGPPTCPISRSSSLVKKEAAHDSVYPYPFDKK